MSSAEFPHSEISGSKDVCSSPKLIAAYHVFHRLPVPRHSPCALFSLTVVYLSINISYFRFSICQRDFTILLSNLRSSVPLGEIIDFIKNQEFYIANKISFCSSIFSFQGTYRIGSRHPVSWLPVVGWNGLEPSTSRLSAECSNQLSYQPKWWR